MADLYDEYMKRSHRDLDEATGRGPSAEIERLSTALAASEAARAEAVAKVREKSGRLAELFWHDCGAEKKRGEAHCGFDGTKVCTVCQLADAERYKELAIKERDQLRSDLAFEREALVVACQERDAARADAEDEREARHAAETLLEYERNALTKERDESDKALVKADAALAEENRVMGPLVMYSMEIWREIDHAVANASARQALAAKGEP
jgi:hypothetical protein